jgi:hypothetical protein
VALPLPRSVPIPPPSHDEALALAIAGSYLTRAGTQVASRLLGCPDPDGEAIILADLSDYLLGSAALCAKLLALADEQRPI